MSLMQYQSLAEEEWTGLSQAHEQIVAPWFKAFRERRRRGESHPVEDFLFVYYNAPSHTLEKWHPTPGTVLKGPSAKRFLKFRHYSETDDGVFLNVDTISESDRKRAQWISRLLTSATNRTPRFHCFGLHEWAMVYKTEDIRHANVPLRISHRMLDDFLETQSIACSHYDAFRFFTPDAIPLNTMQPAKDNRSDFEQCGCVHFNMDLYKWAYKLHPWTSSELIRDCFLLAMQARQLDMQASPYDLSAFSIEPIKIETPQGRLLYQQKQQIISTQATPLREQLVDTCQAILSNFENNHPTVI